MAPKVLFAKSCPADLHQAFVKEAFLAPDKVYSSIFRDFLPKFDYITKLKSNDKPLLCLWGKEDQLIPIEMRQEMIETLSSDLTSHNTLPGGHMFPLESPLQVGREISKFIYSKRSRITIE
jgi:pimeloyl-ACP methyl ester carboxylesterase